jgi:NAD-reducing hydrogenase large subunit
VSEAPRGTLFHHYRVDKDGVVVWANLIIATGHNNLAMNQGVLQVARHYIKGADVEEGMLNRLEAVIRTFDPCLSCSTHATGQMPLQVEIVGTEGQVVRRIDRSGG